MKIADIIKLANMPELYEPGNAIMWTDSHISKQLLDVHLNTNIDLASRKLNTIHRTVGWLLTQSNKKKLKILDLGCGPGLYAEILASEGHQVTGIDFSENSISYAQHEANIKKLDIQYHNENYLKWDFPENEFDLVLLVFTDFGVLLPKERDQLLRMIKRGLATEGIFVFDVLNDNAIESKLSPNGWEAAEQGFWDNKPYLALSESYLYKEAKVILYQHIIIDEEETIKTYRFWNHFFSNSDLDEILLRHGFENIRFHSDVLPSGDGYEGNEVTFCIAGRNPKTVNQKK